MNNSVQTLIAQIEELRGETVRVFGQPVTLPTTEEISQYVEVDVLKVLRELKGWEADMTMTTLNHSRIEELEEEIMNTDNEIAALQHDVAIGRLDLEDEEVKECYEERMEALENELSDLKASLEEAHEEYLEKEAEDIEEYLEYLKDYYGLKETMSNNTYNNGGNISNHYYTHFYKCGNDCVYVRLAVHRYGDVRANYTDEVLLKFDSELEAYEVLTDGGYESFSVEINGEDYNLDVRAESEGIEVYNEEGSYVCTIYGTFTLEEAREEIANKLGIKLDSEISA